MTCNMQRRKVIHTLSGLLGAAVLPISSRAANYPDRPVRFVAPFNPGGNVDGVARLLAAAMGPFLGQPVVVENRAGAGGSLGAGIVAQSPADGYTLLVGSNGPLTINPLLQPKQTYDPLKDFSTVALAGVVPHVLLVNNDLKARNLKELIALSQNQSLSCGSSGIGSSTHLTLERFNTASGSRLVHVPYRGGSSLVPDLLSGNIHTVSMEYSTALPFHKSGKARIIAIASARRSPLTPDVPTYIESGVQDFTAYSFVGLLAPARVPEPVMRKLVTAAESALSLPNMADRLQALGIEPANSAMRGPGAFGTFLREEYERTRETVRNAGIRAE